MRKKAHPAAVFGEKTNPFLTPYRLQNFARGFFRFCWPETHTAVTAAMRANAPARAVVNLLW
jgi:hypothetical protein